MNVKDLINGFKTANAAVQVLKGQNSMKEKIQTLYEQVKAVIDSIKTYINELENILKQLKEILNK